MKLEQKYGGKALRMLEKMGGYKLGEGVGKHNQGILNPIETDKIVDKGGIGYQNIKEISTKKKLKKDEIDMDIHNKVDEQKKQEEVVLTHYEKYQLEPRFAS